MGRGAYSLYAVIVSYTVKSSWKEVMTKKPRPAIPAPKMDKKLGPTLAIAMTVKGLDMANKEKDRQKKRKKRRNDTKNMSPDRRAPFIVDC